MINWHPIIFMLLLFHEASCLAEKVLLAPTSTSPDEYESAISSYPDVISPIDHYLRKTPSSSSMEDLFKRFSHAEQSFIDASELSVTVEQYKKVLELEMTEDWDEEQRRLFLISYLRLLQIRHDTEDPKERAAWIEQALFYLQTIEAPRDLISPNIFREIEMKTALYSPKELVVPPRLARKYQKVLIQGKVYDTDKPIRFHSNKNKQRWTFLSYFFEAVTIHATHQEITAAKIKSQPILSSECENSTLNSGQVPKALAQIYTPLHCSKANAPAPAKTIKEISLPISLGKTSSQWKMKKRHWIWIGVGALATAVVLSQLTQSEKTADPVPTESYGF